jgi:hypothetical protein
MEWYWYCLKILFWSFYIGLEWPKNQSISCLPWSYLAERYDVPSLVWYEIKQDISLISLHHQFVPEISIIFIMKNNVLQKRTIWNGTGIV